MIKNEILIKTKTIEKYQNKSYILICKLKTNL